MKPITPAQRAALLAHARKGPAEQLEVVRILVERDWNDVQIARQLGLSKYQVMTRRRKLALLAVVDNNGAARQHGKKGLADNGCLCVPCTRWREARSRHRAEVYRADELEVSDRNRDHQAWTPEEDELVKSSIHAKDVAQQIGRSVASVRQRRAMFRPMNMADRHIAQKATEMRRDGMTYRQIQSVLGVDWSRLSKLVRRLECTNGQATKSRSHRPWTREEEAELLSDDPVRVIAVRINRTPDAVRQRRMSLRNRAGLTPVPHIPWTPEEDTVALACETGVEAAEKLGRSAPAARSRRALLRARYSGDACKSA